MDIQDRLEVFWRHLLQGRCANDAGVMDENVDPAIVVQRRFSDRTFPFRRKYRRGNRDGFASGGYDLSRHRLRGTGIEASPSSCPLGLGYIGLALASISDWAL